MKLKLIEPLRDLFKDEVRRIGRDMQMPEEILQRQPFPGPGLAVRILGEVTADRVALLQEADDIVVTEIKAAGLYQQIWQSFAVLLPVRSVGVAGDQRTYGYTCAIRAVHSEDGMTADWVPLPYEVLKKISDRITNEVHGITASSTTSPQSPQEQSSGSRHSEGTLEQAVGQRTRTPFPTTNKRGHPEQARNPGSQASGLCSLGW